MKDINRKLAHK